MEFPPCHIGDFFPAIRGISSRSFIEIPRGFKEAGHGVATLQFTVCVCQLRCGHTEILSTFVFSEA